MPILDFLARIVAGARLPLNVIRSSMLVFLKQKKCAYTIYTGAS